MSDRPRLGISECLLGHNVRYDGQHKLNHFLVDTLGKHVDFVPVCPEVECGLGVPREAMRLVGEPEAPRLMTRSTGIDLTEKMTDWIGRRLRELEREELCGFIFKSKSPSSGMEGVKVYNGRGGVSGKSPGLFGKAFVAHFPLLPVEDDGRLNDPDLRENFIERIFALQRYRERMTGPRRAEALVAFHAEHKFLLMAHSETHCRDMGRLVAQGRGAGDEGVRRYEERLLQALKLIATPAKHTNVLQHIMGFLKAHLSADEKQELLDLIARFRAGELPLIVPVTLLNHYARKYAVAYVANQYYLHPHPLELKLRNHA